MPDYTTELLYIDYYFLATDDGSQSIFLRKIRMHFFEMDFVIEKRLNELISSQIIKNLLQH